MFQLIVVSVKMRAAAFVSILVLAATTPSVYAHCKDTGLGLLDGDAPKSDQVANSNGSLLVMETARCDTKVFHKYKDKKILLVGVKGGSGWSKFVDINNDGNYEVVVNFNDSMLNPTETAFLLDTDKNEAAKLLTYNGQIKIINNFLFVEASGNGISRSQGFKIRNLFKLQIDKKSSIAIHYESRNDERPFCHLTLSATQKNLPFTRQVVNEFCIDAEVQYGWHPER